MSVTYGSQYGTGPYGSETTEDGSPTLSIISPLGGSIDVPLEENIRLRISLGVVDPWTIHVDRGSGFELALTYNAGDVFSPAFAGPASKVVVGSSYEVVIDPVVDFPVWASVTVKVTGVDADGNPIIVL